MDWCTPTDVIAAESDVDRLALLAGASDRPAVAGSLLRLAVAGEDLSEYLPMEQEAAAAALARLETACATAGDYVAAALAVRWPSGFETVPSLIRGAAIALAIEDLLGARPAGPDTAYGGIVRSAANARKTLTALADGTLMIGAPVNTPLTVRFQAADRLSTAATLAGMG